MYKFKFLATYSPKVGTLVLLNLFDLFAVLTVKVKKQANKKEIKDKSITYKSPNLQYSNQTRLSSVSSVAAGYNTFYEHIVLISTSSGTFGFVFRVKTTWKI